MNENEKLLQEFSEMAEKHLPKLTAGALQKRLLLVDELEEKIKSMEGVAKQQLENYKTLEEKFVESQKDVEKLSAYKEKEAELNVKEASLKEKEFQLTTKEGFATALEDERKESKKQFFDVVTTVLGSQIKTEKVSKLFSEIPVFDGNGGTTIKKIGEESEKKSS